MSTVFASANGSAFNLLNYLFKPGISGGQVAFGGTDAGDLLDFQGSDNADVGRIALRSPTEFFYSEGNTTPAEQSCVRWRPTFTTAGAYIGGFFLNSATITYTNSFYIYSSIQDNSIHISNAAAGFQAWTLFNALCSINNGTSNDSVQAITLNDGVTHRRTTAGTTTAIQHIGLSFSGAIRADVASSTMTLSGGMTGLSFAPKHNTQTVTSTVNYGTLNAVSCTDVAAALFAFSNGTENMTAYNGINFPDMTFIASGAYRVINSQLNAGTNKRFLNHTGTAISTMNGQLRFEADLTGITFGASQDVQMGWGGAGFYFMQFNALADQIRISNPAADRFEITDANTGQDGEIGFGFDKGSFGELGAAGNNKYRFVAQAETVTVGGEYSQFLLTQAANDTIDAALSLYAGWTINAPSPTLGTGSLTTAAALNVGGNPGAATVNRVGLRIISNPSGGSGVNAALWVTAGLSQFDGRVDINNPIALGGGATATLGTIGGSGPTTAAQAQWVEIDVNGVAHWIPAWT